MITRFQGIGLALLVIGDFIFGAVCAARLPQRVPVHWNFQGEVDRYGSPWELAFILPLTLAITTGVMVALPFLGKTGEALDRSGQIYGRIVLFAVGSLVAMHVMMLVLWNQPQDIVTGNLVNLGVLFMVLGNWTSKIRRNPIMGVRTPWTLKSDYVWERTNRMGARVMVAHGVAIVASAFLLPIWATFTLVLGGAVAEVVWAMLYSRSLARGEAQRQAGLSSQ
jgi:uncharacterized membrane protein